MKTVLNNICCPHCSRLLTVLNSIVITDSGSTMLFNVVNRLEQCGQQNIVQYCFHQLGTSCSFFAVYGNCNCTNVNRRENLQWFSYGLYNVFNFTFFVLSKDLLPGAMVIIPDPRDSWMKTEYLSFGSFNVNTFSPSI